MSRTESKTESRTERSLRERNDTYLRWIGEYLDEQHGVEKAGEYGGKAEEEGVNREVK